MSASGSRRNIYTTSSMKTSMKSESVARSRSRGSSRAAIDSPVVYGSKSTVGRRLEPLPGDDLVRHRVRVDFEILSREEPTPSFEAIESAALSVAGPCEIVPGGKISIVRVARGGK